MCGLTCLENLIAVCVFGFLFWGGTLAPWGVNLLPPIFLTYIIADFFVKSMLLAGGRRDEVELGISISGGEFHSDWRVWFDFGAGGLLVIGGESVSPDLYFRCIIACIY